MDRGPARGLGWSQAAVQQTGIEATSEVGSKLGVEGGWGERETGREQGQRGRDIERTRPGLSNTRRWAQRETDAEQSDRQVQAVCSSLSRRGLGVGAAVRQVKLLLGTPPPHTGVPTSRG